MISALLLLALAVPSPAPDPAILRSAWTALDACLAELEIQEPTSTVAPALVQLARAAQRSDACAEVGWVRALIAEQALAELRRAPLQCPPPPEPAPAQACEERPLWLDLLSHSGAAALGGLGGYGICSFRKD